MKANSFVWMIRQQLINSRAHDEGFVQKCRRVFWSVVYWLKAVRCGIRAIDRPSLGSLVRYNGQVWRINNAVSDYSLCGLSADDRRYLERVKKSDCQPVRTPVEWWRRFRHAYTWQLGYHHGNEVSCRMRGDVYALHDIHKRRHR